MSEDPSDAELVRRFTAGDHSAFAILVERHEKRVYNIAYRLTGRVEDAKDATQDAFLSALRKLPSFRGDAAFGTWIHRIAVNASYDILRSRKRSPLADAPDYVEPGPPTPDHSESVARSVDAQRALTLVPYEFRTVLVLHDVQDLPYEEIAEILDVPLGTVKSRLHRGRMALAALITGTRTPRRPSEGRK